ncbi:MAG: AAA family ATPase [Bacteroidia bacterium]|nr:AAA family ATPase [Bacteroidia bacterium]
MKILPISKQEFSRLINDNCVYVDKTEIIYKLITTGFSYFLSRPRRFGKSLTLTTLKEIFSGNKELFKGLWIYDKIEWRQYPIIHFDFSDISKSSISVIESIIVRLDEIAKEYEITLQQADYGLRFRELIRELSKTEQIVILVDEYDKPIIDYIDDIPQAEKNRIILKNFYSVLKGNEKNIKFLFITGVSKFSKVSIFSDLNHLSDITLNPNYSILTGYTEDELEKYFSEYMALAQGELNEFFPDLKSAIRKWYNGYSWDGKNFVYNPFSLLNFFDNRKFEDYWFQSGTPTFLMKLIKQRNFNITKLENIPVTSDIFNKYELSKLELIALLFQTGYLTVKKYEIKTGEYFLSYPNNEVRASFERQLLETLSEKSLDENAILLNDIKTA